MNFYEVVKKLGKEFLSKTNLCSPTVYEPRPLLYDISKTERIVEYAWVLGNLDSRHITSILDVGCGETMFPMMLASLGRRVVGVDLKDYNWQHPHFTFILGNIMCPPTVLLRQKFDCVTAISTLEHVGLCLVEKRDEDGDIKAISQIRDVLRDKGIALLTLPFGKYDVIVTWRIYDENRLKRLCRDFKIDKMEFFMRKGEIWQRCQKDDVSDVTYKSYPGAGEKCKAIVCIKLVKT